MMCCVIFQNISFMAFGTFLWFLGTLLQLFQKNMPAGYAATQPSFDTGINLVIVTECLLVVPFVFVGLATQEVIFGAPVSLPTVTLRDTGFMTDTCYMNCSSHIIVNR